MNDQMDESIIGGWPADATAIRIGSGLRVLPIDKDMIPHNHGAKYH
jgi:hypothetical protein